MAVAADVPNIYDVVISGLGYILANPIAPNLPFRTQRARYSYSPTFVTRQNVSGSYGDNQQDFWLTESQKDWALGDGQKFFRANDADSQRRYWTGKNLDISIPGQVKIAPAIKTNISFTNPALGAAGTAYTRNTIYVVDATTLFSISNSGVITNLGAHGAGTPFARGLIADGNFLYIAGSTALRAYDLTGATFATFNAAAFEALAFTGNTLYAVDSVMSSFYRFDTAGTSTNLFTFKDAKGGSRGVVSSLKSYGGKVLLLRSSSEENRGSTLWQYAGTGLSTLAELPPNFRGDQMDVVGGVVFIAGAFLTRASTWQPAIYYFANGTLGLLWKAPVLTQNATVPSLVAFQQGLVFTDEVLGNFMYYDFSTGAISTIGSFTVGNVSWTNSTGGILAASGTSFIHTRNSTSTYFFPDTTQATSGIVYSSLFDFDSSLTKLFRAVIVEFEPGSDGDGGSIDVAYQVNSVDLSYTSLIVGAVSGSENLMTGVSGRSISLKITLNKGTSTLGPTLKRVYVRAVPIQQTFRSDEMILDCSGANGKTPVILRNGNPHNLDGQAMVTNLRTAITSTTPITITDRFGTITAVVDVANVEIIEIRPEEYYVRMAFREV